MDLYWNVFSDEVMIHKWPILGVWKLESHPVNDYLPNHDFNFNLGKTTITTTTSTATSHNGVKGTY